MDGRPLADALIKGLKPEDPLDVDRAVAGFTKQLVQAQAPRDDVETPTSQFEAKFADTEPGKTMTEHMRLNPDAKTVAGASCIPAPGWRTMPGSRQTPRLSRKRFSSGSMPPRLCQLTWRG